MNRKWLVVRALGICGICASLILCDPAVLFAAPQARTAKAAFSLAFYRALAKTQKGRDFVFSPYSIRQGFGLAALGSRGETRAEIEKVLAPGRWLGSSPEISIANRLWIQKGYRIEKKFLHQSRTEFGAAPGVMDFYRNPERSTRAINAWVREQTHKKINHLIPPNTLSASSKLVLTNAIYFKARWEYPFIPGDTYQEKFQLPSGRKVSVPFMHERQRFYYGHDKEVQVVQLPYAGYRFSMLLILPKPGVALSRIENELTPEKLHHWSESLKSTDVQVGLPRFRFDSSFVLNGPLKSLGVKSAFTTQADFSAIDGKKDLFIAQVFHKAFLNVNEESTEASAATAIHMQLKAMRRLVHTEPVHFIANRPFLLLIQETNTKTILFMGRLTNPWG